MKFKFNPFELFSIVLVAFFSCEKPESLYKQPTIPQGLQTQTFAMGENYSNQLWFDFETQKTTVNTYGDWDIAVSCQDEPSVVICGGKNTNFSVAEFENVSFKNIDASYLTSAKWKFDQPSGNIDSSAFGRCFNKVVDGYEGKSSIFVLDLGEDSLKSFRYIKIQFIGVKGGAYQFKWGYVNVPALAYLTQMVTDPTRNYVYYSFSKKDVVVNEPVASEDWDLVFTTYKESINDPNGVPYSYIIRGALANLKTISIAQIDKGIVYEACDKTFAAQQKFSNNADEIGYDWKEYSQSSGKYTIIPNRYYIIKTSTNDYFKMKFVDFYDDQGRKGYPKMAWQILP